MSANVLVIDPLDEQTLSEMRWRWHVVHLQRPNSYELRKELAAAHALVLRSGIRLTSELIAGAPNLKVIVRGGAGMDNIDQEAAAARGIPVYNLPEAGSQSVAELGLALILASLRHLVPAHNSLIAGEWAKPRLWGEELTGKVVGLIGFGRIGSRLAKLLQPFEVRLLGLRSRMDEEGREKMRESGVIPATLPEILRNSDVITLQMPLTPETRHILNSRTLAEVTRQPLIVNLGRWDLIESGALIEALRAGLLRSVAIDPVEPEGIPPELKTFPNVLLLPHIGAQTIEAQARASNSILRYLSAHLAAEEE